MLVTTSHLKPGTLNVSGHPFSLNINTTGWKEVEVGTFSDGSAVLELAGPLENMYLLIFRHGHDESLNSVSYWRQKLIVNEYPNAKCEHERKFEEGSFNVNATVICRATYIGDPVLEITKSIRTEQGIYEITGFFSSMKYTYRDHEEHFINTAEGFKAND